MEIFRAPELSATSRIVRIWIMASLPRLGLDARRRLPPAALVEDLFHPPALVAWLSGRVSTMRTRSPCLAPFSSWAMKVEVRLMVLR